MLLDLRRHLRRYRTGMPAIIALACLAEPSVHLNPADDVDLVSFFHVSNLNTNLALWGWQRAEAQPSRPCGETKKIVRSQGSMDGS